MIAKRANEILRGSLADVKRFFGPGAATAGNDYLHAYIEDLPNVVDVRDPRRGHPIGADPSAARASTLGCDRRGNGLDLTVVNPLVDATWRFMTLDTDGKIRMPAVRPTRWRR